MMRTVIIEDEHIAALGLKALVEELAPELEVCAVLQSVDESIEWFGSHGMPELVFMDIHLADGSSFTIFESVEITAPVIFTTAYDEYALKAFEVNSVDYLLKPIGKQQFERALNKFRSIGSHRLSDNQDVLERLMREFNAVKKETYKASLLIPHKDKLIPVSVGDIAYVFIDNKIVWAVLFGGGRYALDQSLDDLAKQLDPKQFYRVNRQYIIARSSVKDISLWFGSKLAVNLTVPTDDRVLISRANSRDFKDWITAG